MQRKTARHRLADLLLGRPVVEFVEERRANGRAWHEIAYDLRDATDGEITVSGEALRQWVASTATAQDGAA